MIKAVKKACNIKPNSHTIPKTFYLVKSLFSESNIIPYARTICQNNFIQIGTFQ